MLESIVIYSSLAFIMIMDGKYAAAKRPSRNDGGYFLAYLIPILAFAFVFGCRYDVGIDYMHYLNRYNYGSSRDSEPVFRFITETMSSSGLHYSFFFALWAAIQITLVYYSLRNHKYLWAYMAFFLIFGTYFMSMMNVIRQQLAACVFMVSIQYIQDKKFIKYVLCIFIASIFHRSAWLLLIAYPLLAWKDDWFKNEWIQLAIYFGVIIISMKYADRFLAVIEEPFVLFTDITGYDDTYQYSLLEEEGNSRAQFGNNTGLGLYINIFLTVPIIMLSNRLRAFYNSSFFNIVYSLFFVSIIAGHLFGNSIILYRPFVYVINFRMVMYSFFSYYCVKKKSTVTLSLFIGFVLMHLAMFLNMMSNGDINKSRFLFFWDV